MKAGIICAREENGELTKNSSGEKIIVLREWNLLLTPQKIALRRQSIGRADWEKLPWTGHFCLLFTRAWEIGRMLSWLKKEGKIDAMTNYLDSCRRHWTDWMRGQVEPPGWEDRFSIRQRKLEREILALRKRLSNTEGFGISLRSSLCLLHQAS